MRNITVTVDDETYRKARLRAAAADTSVSQLVRAYLQSLAAEGDEFDRKRAEEEAIRARIAAFDAGARIDRDALHDRSA